MPSVKYSTGAAWREESIYSQGLNVSNKVAIPSADVASSSNTLEVNIAASGTGYDFTGVETNLDITNAGISSGTIAAMRFNTSKDGAGTALYLNDIRSNCEVLAGILAYRYGIYFKEATGAGTLITQVGILIDALTKATNNVGILLAGGNSIQWRSGAAQIASGAIGQLDLTASTLTINGSTGWTGSFTNGEGDTVTVTDGIITGVS